jgi:hypothetical protein
VSFDNMQGWMYKEDGLRLIIPAYYSWGRVIREHVEMESFTRECRGS